MNARIPAVLPILAASLLVTACSRQEEPAPGSSNAVPTQAAPPASEVWKERGAELGARAGETLGTLRDQTAVTASNVVEKSRELGGKAKAEGTRVVDAAKELGTKAAEGTKEATQKVVEGTKEATQKVVEGTKEAVDRTVEAVQDGVRKLPKP